MLLPKHRCGGWGVSLSHHLPEVGRRSGLLTFLWKDTWAFPWASDFCDSWEKLSHWADHFPWAVERPIGRCGDRALRWPPKTLAFWFRVLGNHLPCWGGLTYVTKCILCNDNMWLPRLVHRRHCDFHLLFLVSLTCGRLATMSWEHSGSYMEWSCDQRTKTSVTKQPQLASLVSEPSGWCVPLTPVKPTDDYSPGQHLASGETLHPNHS